MTRKGESKSNNNKTAPQPQTATATTTVVQPGHAQRARVMVRREPLPGAASAPPG